MKNKQTDKQRELSNISYESIFNEIDQRIHNIRIHQTDNKKGLFVRGIQDTAYEITRTLFPKVKNEEGFKEIFKVDYNKNPLDTTLNFEDGNVESSLVTSLCNSLQYQLNLTEFDLTPDDLKSYICNRENNRNSKINFGVTVDKNMSSQVKLAEMLPDKEATKASSEHIREDKLIIKYDSKDLISDIKGALIDFLESDEADYLDLDEDELDEVIEEIEKRQFLTQELYTFITDQQKGCLSRVSNYLYLDFIANNVDTSKLNKDDLESFNILKNYIKRFDLFEDFCTQALLEGAAYNCTIIKPFSLLDEFRKSEVYNFLPLIGKTSSNFVFANDKNLTKSIESYGTHFKLNCGVSNHEIENPTFKGKKIESSLLYTLAEISDNLNKVKDPKTQRKNGILKKSLIRVILLKFFLTNLNDDTYNPVIELKNDLKGIRMIQDTGSASNFIAKIQEHNRAYYKNNLSINTNKMVNFVKKSLEANFYASNNLTNKTYKRDFIIFPGYLPNDILEKAREYNVDKKPRTHKMRYTTLMKQDGIKVPTLFDIEYEITFKTTLTKNEMNQSLNNQNSIKNKFIFDDLFNLNVVFYPQYKAIDQEKNMILRKTNEKAFSNIHTFKSIYIPYLLDSKVFDNEVATYIYKNTYSILVICILSLIAEASRIKTKIEDPNNLHINILRIHHESEQDTNREHKKENDFVAIFSKRLSMLLNQKYNANSQGFDLTAENPSFTYPNAIRSLYSSIPQVFEFNESKDRIKTNKIAMIVATSMVHDKAHNYCNIKESFSNLLGKVVLFDSDSNSTTLKQHKTFCDTYKKDDLFSKPFILSDIATELKELGYKDVIFLAQAPYTTKMLEGIENQELYFMNEDIIKMLSVNGSLNVYPLFYNTSRVLDCRSNALKDNSAAMYIDNTKVMSEDMYKDLNGIIPILNLYSAYITKNLNREAFYNSLITYMSLKEIYSDDTLNDKITSALTDGDFKKDLTKALALYHFADFQKNSQGKLDIKINPYNTLIGDEGIAKCSRDEYNLHYRQLGNGFSQPIRMYHNSLAFCNFILQNAFNYKVTNTDKNRENEIENIEV